MGPCVDPVLKWDEKVGVVPVDDEPLRRGVGVGDLVLFEARLEGVVGGLEFFSEGGGQSLLSVVFGLTGFHSADKSAGHLAEGVVVDVPEGIEGITSGVWREGACWRVCPSVSDSDESR